jgi:hypothetical protein
MNILVWIVNLALSFGEITNAYSFAEDLAKKGINIYFYKTNEFVENYLNNCTFKFPLLEMAQIKNIKFDMVIFSEYVFLFKGANFSFEIIDFVADNFINKIPIGTLDSINISSSISFVDNKPVFRDPTNLLNFLPVVFPEREYFFIIHVCPTNYPANNKSGPFPAYYWSRPELAYDGELDSKLREIYLIKPGTCQIFLPLSKWQPYYWQMDFNFIENLSGLLGDFITFLFESLNLEIDYSIFFGVPGLEFRKFEKKNFSAYYFIPDPGSYLAQDMYDQFLARTDLILTLFFIQNSFIRSVHSGISGINLTHQVYPVKEKFYEDDQFFLNEIKLNNFYVIDYNNENVRTNPYFYIFENFELLDKGLMNYLKQTILYGKTEQEKERFRVYRSGLESCWNAADIVREAVHK